MPALALRRGSLLLTAISLSHSISLYRSLSLSRGASRLLSKSSNTAWRASVDIKQLRPLRLVMPRPSAECSVMHACFLTDGAHAHMHSSTQTCWDTCRTLPISGLDPISTNKLCADGGFSCTSFIFFWARTTSRPFGDLWPLGSAVEVWTGTLRALGCPSVTVIILCGRRHQGVAKKRSGRR